MKDRFAVQGLMSTQEVAEYLRIKERKVYSLVKARGIPCTRVAGKWLFPRDLIDAWLLDHAIGPDGHSADAQRGPAQAPPPTLAGSHDPLLEWAVRESACGLALMSGGSLDGLGRVAKSEALLAGTHLVDAATGGYTAAPARASLGERGLLVVEWAMREQGLVVAPGNPLGLHGLDSLKHTGARLILRQAEAGSHVLLQHLLARAGIELSTLNAVAQRARSESDVAVAIREGKADAGLAVAVVAGQLGLDFVPLHRERFDLVMRRRSYFEPPVQSLLAFCRSPALTSRAGELAGYDVSGLGRVIYNGP